MNGERNLTQISKNTNRQAVGIFMIKNKFLKKVLHFFIGSIIIILQIEI